MVIPFNPKFNSPGVVCVDITEFEQTYSETIMEDSEACKDILGKWFAWDI